MEYGRIPEKDLDRLNFTLPHDPASNDLVLRGNTGTAKFYMGAPQWGRKQWVGKLYPKGTKDSNFLNEYVKHYNAIELNATHYGLPEQDMVTKWAEKALQKDFKFCPKMINSISHYSGFKNTEELTNGFIESMLGFGKHLGPIFIQVSERFSPDQQAFLCDYLKTLPKDLTFFLEVRQSDWFDQTQEQFFNKMRDLQIGMVITDTWEYRKNVHMHLTTSKTMIRFLCLGNHHTDMSRIDEWAQRIKAWQDKGLQECYFFVHPLKDALAPEITSYVAKQFNKICNAGLPEPKLLTLF